MRHNMYKTKYSYEQPKKLLTTSEIVCGVLAMAAFLSFTVFVG